MDSKKLEMLNSCTNDIGMEKSNFISVNNS